MREEKTDFSDIPEVTEDQIEMAILCLGYRIVPKGRLRINIFLDVEAGAYFKAQACGRGNQTLINEAFRENISAQGITTRIRKTICEKQRAA